MTRKHLLLGLFTIGVVWAVPNTSLADTLSRGGRSPLLPNRPLWPTPTWNDDQRESMLRQDGEALARMYKAGRLSEERLVSFLQDHVVTASRWGRSGFERGFVWKFSQPSP